MRRAPGSGRCRRNPDLKWRQTETALVELGAKQAAISRCRDAGPAGGALLYATCSLLAEENEASRAGVPRVASRASGWCPLAPLRRRQDRDPAWRTGRRILALAARRAPHGRIFRGADGARQMLEPLRGDTPIRAPRSQDARSLRRRAFPWVRRSARPVPRRGTGRCPARRTARTAVPRRRHGPGRVRAMGRRRGAGRGGDRRGRAADPGAGVLVHQPAHRDRRSSPRAAVASRCW